MPNEFVPGSELERAYIQATGWDAQRLWRKILQNGQREDWAVVAAYTLCLALHYALVEDESFNDAFDSLLAIESRLTSRQKFSLFKVCGHAVLTLLEQGDELSTPTVYLIVATMLRVMSRTGELEGTQILEMMRTMQTIYGGPDWLIEFTRQVEMECQADKQSEAQEIFFGKAEPVPQTVQSRWLAEPPGEKPRGYAIRPQEPPPDQPGRFEADLGRRFVAPDLPARIPKGRSAAPVNRSDLDHVQLMLDYTSAVGEFGMHSTETAQALVRLSEFSVQQNIVPVGDYLQDLCQILEDDSVEVSDYDLRRVATLTDESSSNPDLLPVLEKLHRVVITRREKSLGHDLNVSLPLTRLIQIWAATDKLEEGQAFCASILDWVQTHFDKGDLLVRQIQSIYDRLGHLQKLAKDDPTIAAARIAPVSHDEQTELMTVFAMLALDHMQEGRVEGAEVVLHEALAYYMDCLSDEARRVGEMIWLLTESNLASIKSFRDKLIGYSMQKAFDTYLRKRFVQHLKVMLRNLDSETAMETIEGAMKLSQDKSATDLPTVDFWHRVVSAKERGVFHKDEKYNDVASAETELTRLLSEREISRVGLILVNDLGEVVVDDCLRSGDHKKAIDVSKRIIEIGIQTKHDIGKWLVRLAVAYVGDGNYCDAFAVIFLAFSDLPGPYDDHDPEAEPLILRPQA